MQVIKTEDGFTRYGRGERAMWLRERVNYLTSLNESNETSPRNQTRNLQYFGCAGCYLATVQRFATRDKQNYVQCNFVAEGNLNYMKDNYDVIMTLNCHNE